MRERVTRLSSYVVLTEAERVLLCRLSSQTSSPGMWTLPGGGLEFGESPEEAVIREVEEETGLAVRDLRLLEVWSSTELFQGKDYHLIRFVYAGSASPGDLRIEANGSTDLCEWIGLSELSGVPLVPLVKRALSL